jgi:hypothetical protein
VLGARCAETCIFNGNYGGAVTVDRESDDDAACHLLEFVNTEDYSALLAATRTTATLDDQWALPGARMIGISLYPALVLL